MDKNKKVILSGIQATGMFTLGNYIGALSNWRKLQEEYNCIYMIADLHSITVKQNPETLRENTLNAFAVMLACGVDPNKSICFIQSHVKTHAELSWILSCYTQFGELSRMTQFKDKSLKNADNINAGLFTYPVLMAADILLYKPDLVPVGADQKQHLELTRDIVNRFNSNYGDTLKVPEPYIPKVGARIMSLTDPTKKMSKSDDNPKSFISILDTPEIIMKKIKSATTDSDGKIFYGEGKDGINNLMSIYSSITGKTFEEIEKEFEGKGYGDFKKVVGKSVVQVLTPIRQKYNDLMENKDYLKTCYEQGRDKALKYSQTTLDKIYKKIGFLQ